MKRVMGSTLVGAAAVAVATTGTGAANAYPGGCLTDAYTGNCVVAPASLYAPGESPINMAAWGQPPDQHFAYFLTHDDYAPMTILNFGVVKEMALRACAMEAQGVDGYTARKSIQYAGGYSFDQANSITSAAEVEYCPSSSYLPRPVPAPSQDTRLVAAQ